MKKWTTALAAIILAVAVTACGNGKNDAAGSGGASGSSTGLGGGVSAAASTSAKSDLDRLKEKGEFIVATTGTYPPYAFHPETGSRDLTGFDVELLKEVFKRIGGVNVKFVETEWEGMLAGLDAGRFDSIHQIGVTEERKKKYDFTNPYLISYPTLIVLEGTNDIRSFNDLKGKKVYGSNTSIYGKLAESKGAVLVPEGEALELLTTKRVDAIIFNNLYYLDLKKNRPDLKIKSVDQLKDQEQVALPLVKGGDGTLIEAFNRALQETKEDGTYKKLSVEWFGQDLTS
ncbi:transporter substrate-binding domain-containing protein [Cohnella sp. AR92]|uniref:transporter substrate-binding domain-containing protein n=1 Tax=Cohnella sp. AR92 TaxID=648716 RepID=UPI000F8DEF4F|nr:transporter substrate-binding domain-containing protein [Cohnella sp. AR92]RUS48538.1 transporter substrate-binding domain-containing protein [Cohnella sp. AR92]